MKDLNLRDIGSWLALIEKRLKSGESVENDVEEKFNRWQVRIHCELSPMELDIFERVYVYQDKTRHDYNLKSRYYTTLSSIKYKILNILSEVT